MHQCCVFGCRNLGSHSFPKEENLRKQWEAAIQEHRKDFRAKKNTKICSAHFKTDDYIKIGRFSGLANTRRILKKGIVPSIFPLTNCAVADQQKGNNKRKKASEEPVSSTLQSCEPKTNTVLHDPSSSSVVPDAKLKVPIPSSCQNSKLICVDKNDRLSDDTRTERRIEVVVVKNEIQECDEILTETDEVPSRDAAKDQYVPEKHSEIACDHCMGDIIGFRYICLQCEKYDLCSVCEGRLVHPRHYMLRVPVPKPCTEIRNVIAAIRAKIEMLEDALKQNSTKWHHYVEIKREPDSFPFEVQADVDMPLVKTEPSLEESAIPIVELENLKETAEDKITSHRTERDDSDTDDATEDWWNETQTGERNEGRIKKCSVIYKQTSEWKVGRKS